MKTRTLVAGALLACAALGGAGCAGAAARDEAVTRQRSADDRIQSYTTVLRALREAPWSREASLELDRAQVWLQRAETLRLDPERADLLALTLEAVEGQLVQIKALYARREAESSLERTRQTYEGNMNQINTLRDQNEAILQQQEGAR